VGKGFTTAKTVIQTDETSSPVVVITPLHREGASNATSLGTLSIHEEGDLRQLQPYAFYRGLPPAVGGGSVLYSVVISMVISTALFLAGLGLLALIPMEFAARGIGLVSLFWCSVWHCHRFSCRRAWVGSS
jgi:hypothetical protein